MELYAEIILDHYQNPHHAGVLKKPTLSAEDTNPLCGDKIRLDLKVDKKGKIRNVGFKGEGCAISQASTSMLTDKLIGKTLFAAAKISNEDIYKMIQVPLTPARVKCALLSLVVLKKALFAVEKSVPTKSVPRKSRTKKGAIKNAAIAPSKKSPAILAESAASQSPACPLTFNENHPYWNVINEVVDPETGIGIADMGIIYDVQQKKGVVDVRMTLTSMGCPAGPDIVANIDGVLRLQPGVKDVMIEVVWDPMWTPDRMKPEIRGMLFGGF